MENNNNHKNNKPSKDNRPSFPKRAVITGGMPYGNKQLHFGHVGGVFVFADTYARFLRDRIGKDNVIFVNTSRGALVNTDDLIAGIRAHKFHGVGLDVYEEEGENVFENREDEIMESSVTARLLSFPNVIITSHQAFFTAEAMSAISQTTLQNATDYMNGSINSANSVL